MALAGYVVSSVDYSEVGSEPLVMTLAGCAADSADYFEVELEPLVLALQWRRLQQPPRCCVSRN